MPNFNTYGIYTGGVVTKGGSSDFSLYISPFMLYGFSGRLAGMGASFPQDHAKKIAIFFGGGAPGGIVAGENTQAPSYTINTGTSSGSVYVYYDESKNDVAFSNVFLANVSIFARVSWILPLNMANVTINTQYVANGNPNRVEANVAYVENPQDAKNFYHDGQKFRSGAINRPLANFSVVTEALQEESLSSIGSTFFLTLINQAHIYKSGNDLGLYPCRHIARESNFAYRTYNSKISDEYGLDSNLAYKKSFDLSTINGIDVLYITIGRLNGKLEAFRATTDSTLYNLNTTHYLIARSIGPNIGSVLAGVTNMSQVQFEIVNNLAGLNSVKENLSQYVKKDVSGLFNPITVGSANTDNNISIPAMYGHILGNSFLSYATTLNLTPPPTSGPRQDLVFLQLTKKYNPDIILTTQLRVFTNINVQAHPEYFSNTGVRALLDNNVSLGNTFTYQPDGSYKSVGNDGNSEYFAIPVAVVNRFNTAAYSMVNPNGGTSRPDNKIATVIHSDEILTVVPVIKSESTKELLELTVSQLLAAKLNSKFISASGNSDSYSRNPLQNDYIGSYTYGSKIGDIDGARRFWAGNEDNNIRMGFAVAWNNSFTYPYANFSYNISTGESTIDLRIPASYQNDARVLTDIAGQPLNVEIFWKSDRSPVELTGQWVPSFNGAGDLIVVCTNTLNLNHPSYISHAAGTEEILVCFSVQYTKARVLSNPIKDMVRVQRNANPGKANHYAYLNQSAANRKKKLTLARVTTINGIAYSDALWLNRSISTVKGHAYELAYTVQGSNLTNTPYIIPSTFALNPNTDINGTYRGLHIVEVKDKNGFNIGVRDVVYKPNDSTFSVYLTQNIPTTDPVQIFIGLDGSQVDITYGALGVKNLVNAEEAQVINVGGTKFTYRYFDTVNNIGGHIITGMSSFNSKYAVFCESLTPTTGYVQIPIRVKGFGGNIIQFDSYITNTEYTALSVLQKTCYEVNSGGYRLPNSADLIFGVMRGVNESNSVVFSYTHGGLPFTPIDPNKTYELLDEGVLLFTTDGAGNDNDTVYSPVGEKFPNVQGGSVIGSGVESQTGITPACNIHQIGLRFAKGQIVQFNGEMGFGVFVQNKKGEAVYISIVREGVKILGLAYVQKFGQMVFNNPNQCFVFELNYLRG